MFYRVVEGERLRRRRVGIDLYRGLRLCFCGRSWALQVGVLGWWPYWSFRRRMDEPLFRPPFREAPPWARGGHG